MRTIDEFSRDYDAAKFKTFSGTEREGALWMLAKSEMLRKEIRRRNVLDEEERIRSIVRDELSRLHCPADERDLMREDWL